MPRPPRLIPEGSLPGRQQVQETIHDSDRKYFVCGTEWSFQEAMHPVTVREAIRIEGTIGGGGGLQSGKTLFNYVSSQEHEKEAELKHVQQRVDQLRNKLQDAELQEALALQTAVIHVVKLTDESKDPALGPSIHVEI